MGEPTWNPNVLDHAKWMKDHIDPEYNVHPVLTTMMPAKNEWLKTAVHTWIRIKNRVYGGNAGLQVSINSTDDAAAYAAAAAAYAAAADAAQTVMQRKCLTIVRRKLMPECLKVTK